MTEPNSFGWPLADPRVEEINRLNAENDATVRELARRKVGVEPVTFVNARVVSLIEVLAERADDPGLMFDVQLRYCRMLKKVLDDALAQTTRIEIVGQVPPFPSTNGGC